jgi:D-cysteine desulfhydrase
MKSGTMLNLLEMWGDRCTVSSV